MSTLAQEKYIKAWNFASLAHNGQFVPGTELPYINHIGHVAMEVMSALTQNITINAPELLVQCALLHDVIEDSSIRYDDVLHEFGVEVAEGVAALSKNKSLPSKVEQMQDSLGRIKKQPKEVWMVKLADRITNLQPPPKHWNKAKIAKYQAEAAVILSSLGEANEYLAARLASKITAYQRYL